MNDRTLIIGPSWVGDMVMAQSLMRVIKLNYPNTLIDVLAPEWSRPLTERMIEVSASIAMPFKHGELNLLARYQLGKQLRKNQYQRCFVLPNSFKSSLIGFWAKIPIRIGWMRECRYPFINRPRFLDKKKYPMMVQRYIALGFEKNAPFRIDHFRPSLTINNESVSATLARYQLTTQHPILIICPGAEFGPSKRWPEQYYAELAAAYLKNNWQVWILGSAKDSEIARPIQELTNNGCVDLTGKTQLGEAIDLMSLAQCVVSNDSGLMHIAAALNRPLVALYGSTDPYFTPPLSDKVKIVKTTIDCSPCFKRECPLQHHQCMKGLSVSKVLNAAQAVCL